MKLPNEIAELLGRQNGTVTSRDIAAVGVSRTMLGRYVVEGLLERVSRGVYVSPAAIQDELFALSKRSDRIVFSHATALFLHSLAERTPFVHTVSVRSGDTLSASLRSDVKCFYVRDAIFGIGLTQVRTQFGNVVPCYDVERTICDIIKCRSRMDDETFLSSLKNYLRFPARNLSRLGEYAARMGIERKVSSSVEALV